jgi:hypothetical protein
LCPSQIRRGTTKENCSGEVVILSDISFPSRTDKEIVRTLKQSLRDVELKLEKIEERFALGEIDRPVYDKIGGKIKEVAYFQIILVKKKADHQKIFSIYPILYTGGLEYRTIFWRTWRNSMNLKCRQ